MAFHDVRATDFPFTVELLREDLPDDQEPLFRRVMTGPGAMAIPALGTPEYRVWARISYPGGRVIDSRKL